MAAAMSDVACTPVLPAATGTTGPTPAPDGSATFGDLVAAALVADGVVGTGPARPGSQAGQAPTGVEDDTTTPHPEGEDPTGAAAAGIVALLLSGTVGTPLPSAEVTASPGPGADAGTGPTPVTGTVTTDAPAGAAPSSTLPEHPAPAVTTAQDPTAQDPSAQPLSDRAAIDGAPTDLAPTHEAVGSDPAASDGAATQPAAVAGPSLPPTTTSPAATTGPTPAVVPHAGVTADPSTAATTRTVAAQVIPEIATLTSRGEGVHRVTLQLNPRALGDVRVVLTMRHGDVHVRLAAGPEARAALGQSSSDLSRALERLGLGEHRIVLTDPRDDAASVVVARGAAQDTDPQAHPDDPTRGRTDSHHPGGFEAREQQQDHHSRTGAEQIAMDGVIPYRSTDPRRGSGQNSSIDLRARPGGVDLRM